MQELMAHKPHGRSSPADNGWSGDVCRSKIPSVTNRMQVPLLTQLSSRIW
jgi:hypothetical protein